MSFSNRSSLGLVPSDVWLASRLASRSAERIRDVNAAPRANAMDDAPTLQVPQQHGDTSLGEPELALHLRCRQRLLPQKQQGPDAALIALEPPKLDDIAHGVRGNCLPRGERAFVAILW